MSNDLQVMQQGPLTADEVRAQVNRIQEIMRDVMQKGQHYGVVPGCGDKPALLKPGAEKIMFTFRLVPDPIVEVIDLQHPTVQGHREYRVTVKLYAKDGTYLGGGVGSCSTMETKYRYRDGDGEATDKPVPREYWDLRKANPAKAQELLGGKGFKTVKNEAGAWMIAKKGEKVEFHNPADYYNTCEKMAKKRALVDATLTVTAASDIFTQDIDEMLDGDGETPASPKDKQSKPEADDYYERAVVKPAEKLVNYLTNNKPEADGAGHGVLVADAPGQTQQASDAPPVKSAADYCKQRAAETNELYEDGVIGNVAPYQGTKAYQKGCKPGYFDLEDGQGGLVRKFKYMDPSVDISSGLKRVFYREEVYQNKVSYAVTKIEALE